MKKQHDKYTVKKMAKFLEVSRSNFYHFVGRKLTKRAIENAEYLKKIKSIHERSRYIYGSPRIHAELKKEGILCSRRRIAKIMRAHGIQAKTHQEVAPNYVNQNFTVDAPNKTWVSDISHIATCEGWLYFSNGARSVFKKGCWIFYEQSDANGPY